jgi:hypothetical protein
MKIEKGKREERKGKREAATTWYTMRLNAHLIRLHLPARAVMRQSCGLPSNGPEFPPERVKFHETHYFWWAGLCNSHVGGFIICPF